MQEQGGRVTNALAWMLATPPPGGPRWPATSSARRWLLPTVRGETAECYAITEEDAGSDVAALEATARRDGDDYVLDGEKWHVTSYNEADYVFFQGVLTDGPNAGEHALFVVDMPTPGMEVVRTPGVHPHHRPPPPDRRVRRRAGAGDAPGRRRGRRDDLRLRVVPVRAADGRRALPRRGRAADRRGDGLRASSRMVGGTAAHRAPAGPGDAGRQPDRAVRGPRRWSTRPPSRSTPATTARCCTPAARWPSSTPPRWPGRVADRAVQIFGGRGYMRENVAERFYRELRVERIWEGASEVQRVIIADQLAKRGLAALI